MFDKLKNTILSSVNFFSALVDSLNFEPCNHWKSLVNVCHFPLLSVKCSSVLWKSECCPASPQLESSDRFSQSVNTKSLEKAKVPTTTRRRFVTWQYDSRIWFLRLRAATLYWRDQAPDRQVQNSIFRQRAYGLIQSLKQSLSLSLSWVLTLSIAPESAPFAPSCCF